jgi:hypothetical protein
MLRDSLLSILGSRLCTPAIKQQIMKELKDRGILAGRKKRQLNLIKPFKEIDIAEFARIMKERRSTLTYYGSNLNRQMETVTEEVA